MKRYLVAACLAVAFAAGVGQAVAYFSARVTVPDNVVTAGTVAVSVEPTAAAVSVPALAPGRTSSSVMTVKNTGTLASNVIVTGAKKAGYTDVYEALNCKVTQGSRVLYEGALSALRTEPVLVPAGAASEIEFEVGLPSSAGNDLQGDYVKWSFYVDAEQVIP